VTTDGLVRIPSSFGPGETMDRLEKEIRDRGLTVFARIDHGEGARQVGFILRPTELLVFGNARGGTPLMQADQETGIDLPLKALVYQDASGKVWLAYNDPQWLAERHHLAAAAAPTIAALTKLLETVAARATTAP
jgi:uncharacterized protein (DUF302 family)